ncbi:hypothetical protein M413DRAFT_72550, partial [Hebeloma cylindrosporum]
MTISEIKDVARIHQVRLKTQERKEVHKSRFLDHDCLACVTYFSIFTCENRVKTTTQTAAPEIAPYPPPPANEAQIKNIIRGFCHDTRPEAFEEAGCAVCGQLNLLSGMKALNESSANLSLLVSDGFTRTPRNTERDPIKELEGPTIDPTCNFICTPCEEQLLSNKVPRNALARGLWLGPVPPELSNLTFAEQMMIARIRHNRCLVRVSSGRAKMIANCIMFSNPTAELY